MEASRNVDAQFEIFQFVELGQKDKAFRKLEQEYKELLMAKSRRLRLGFVYNDNDRLDAILKAFEDVYLKIRKGEVVSNLPQYLFAFVKNNLLNINRGWRRFYRPLRLFEPSKIDVATIDKNIEQYQGAGEDRLVSINLAFKQLDPTCQRIIRLKKIDNCSHEEIASSVPEIKNASISAKRLERCLKHFKQLAIA